MQISLKEKTSEHNVQSDDRKVFISARLDNKDGGTAIFYKDESIGMTWEEWDEIVEMVNTMRENRATAQRVFEELNKARKEKAREFPIGQES